jgi:tRNA1(Val) A37 N6-methylase TrmN6
VRFIHPKADREANMVLIEAVKAGKPDGIRILPPLTVYADDGTYTPAVQEALYGK